MVRKILISTSNGNELSRLPSEEEIKNSNIKIHDYKIVWLDLDEEVKRFVERISKFGDVSYRKVENGKIPYYELSLSHDILINFYKNMYKNLMEYIANNVNEESIKKSKVRKKIVSMVVNISDINLVKVVEYEEEGMIFDFFEEKQFFEFNITNGRNVVRIYGVFELKKY